MSSRFTETGKWSDPWFCQLTRFEKLLFNFLCDNCDIAGFIEINYKTWSSALDSDKEEIKGALKGLERGLIFSDDGEIVYLVNFLKHQKNTELNPSNMAHRGILKCYESVKYKFSNQEIHNKFQRGFKGASKGLQSPIGIGISISTGIGNEKEEESNLEEDSYPREGRRQVNDISILDNFKTENGSYLETLCITLKYTPEQMDKLADKFLKIRRTEDDYHKSPRELRSWFGNWVRRQEPEKEELKPFSKEWVQQQADRIDSLTQQA